MEAKFSDLNLLSLGHTIQLVGAIYAGEGKVYLCFLPEDHPNGTDEVQPLLMNTEEWKVFLHQTDVLQTEILTKASDGTIAKAIVRKTQRNIDQNVSWRVWRRDGAKCRYCGDDRSPLTVDHLILWEEFGPSIEANLVSACRKCNRTRGRTQYKEWITDHPYYRNVSERLPFGIREHNEALIDTLDSIPRLVHQRSR